MTIERFYNVTVSVERMSWSGESSAEISAGSVKGHIQQAGPEFAEFIGEVNGQTYLFWCDEDADIEDGDTLTISSGDYSGTYSVRNIQLNSTGKNKHKQITLIKD